MLIGKWVRTRQDSVHTAFRDWTKLCRNSVADSLVLSPIQFTPRIPTRQDKTVLSCRCSRCELAITRPPDNGQEVKVYQRLNTRLNLINPRRNFTRPSPDFRGVKNSEMWPCFSTQTRLRSKILIFDRRCVCDAVVSKLRNT